MNAIDNLNKSFEEIEPQLRKSANIIREAQQQLRSIGH
jgi:hypothetical protein